MAQGFIAGKNPFVPNQVLGVYGRSANVGVAGLTNALAPDGIGVYGGSIGGNGVGVMGDAGAGRIGDAHSAVGIWGRSARGGVAGRFTGNVEIDGDLNLLHGGDVKLLNGDCAEEFNVLDSEEVEAGTVMVIDDTGVLKVSETEYDRRVAGVISGSGDYKPAIILDKRTPSDNRKPLALMGKVCCKVDAGYGAIAIGDLLTTSPTSGHAMRVGDHFKAFGAVIGKALGMLAEGRGVIPILVALQ